MVNKHTGRYVMTNRRRTIFPFAHQITKTKKTKITKTRRKKKGIEERRGRYELSASSKPFSYSNFGRTSGHLAGP
jgi:hypothetical protein